LLDADAKPVRCLLFDKTPSANWLVPWHRDTTICVRERVDVDGFGPWSIKDGRVHVQPPLRVLRNMVTLRLHIDEANARNGALRVIPGSHNCQHFDEVGDDSRALLVEAEPGSVLAMKPLVLHASSKATSATRRRILHIEYAACDLPDPLCWG
jgi:ectoine hydroxylase-related dioxygenase (phytanoyl-CoA dioxygenase family)